MSTHLVLFEFLKKKKKFSIISKEQTLLAPTKTKPAQCNEGVCFVLQAANLQKRVVKTSKSTVRGAEQRLAAAKELVM